MTLSWLPASYTTRDPIAGISSASFDYEADPTWKLLVHTTEGASYAGAKASYRANGFAPNLTAGPDPSRDKFVRAWQHLPLTSRSTTLADDSGGIRTNRDYVVQVEVVGFCDPKYASSPYHVDNWPEWYAKGVARILNDILDGLPIPRRSTVTWVAYPKSYGEHAAQRLTTAQYDAYEGILGHQHAPENGHGDPGNIAGFVRKYLLDTAPPAQTSPSKDADDMTQEQAQQLAEVHAALATIGSTYKQAKAEPERYGDLMKAVQTWGGRAQDAGQEAAAKVAALGEKVEALTDQVAALAEIVGKGAARG